MFKILKINRKTGATEDFIKNKDIGPSSWFNNGGIERPVSVKFDPNVEVLYIVDFGIVDIKSGNPDPKPYTGVIWKVTKK